MRKEADSKSEKLTKILNNEIVYIYDSLPKNSNWVATDYLDNNNHLISGYIYKDRLKEVSQLKKIPLIFSDSDYAKFSLHHISIELVKKPFDYKSNGFFLKQSMGI